MENDLGTASRSGHADDHLHSRRPAGPRPRPLQLPRPPGPAEDGGALAQEPRPEPRCDRRLRRSPVVPSNATSTTTLRAACRAFVAAKGILLKASWSNTRPPW